MNSCGERKQYTIPLPTKLVEFLKGKRAKRVLDVGCGCGRACFYLHENGYEAVGVDVNREQVSLAQEEAKTRGIEDHTLFLVTDARHLCFAKSSFDAVMMLGLLTLVPESHRKGIIDEATRVLRWGGYVFVEEFGRTWLNPVYSRRYREDYAVTGELGTFTVKDESGRILHLAHHFSRAEIINLFGRFHLLSLEEAVFTSYYHKNWVKGYLMLSQKGNE